MIIGGTREGMVILNEVGVELLSFLTAQEATICGSKRTTFTNKLGNIINQRSGIAFIDYVREGLLKMFMCNVWSWL